MNCTPAQHTTLSDQKVDRLPAYAVEGALPHPILSPSEVRRRTLRIYAARVLKVCGLVTLVLLCQLFMDSVNTRRDAPVAGSDLQVGEWDGDISLGNWPDLPPDVKSRRCANSSEWKTVQTSAPYASSITLQLSSQVDLLFLLSRGPAFGTVQIMQTGKVGTKISVTTVVEYNKGDALDQTTVCTVDNVEVKSGDGFAVLARNNPPPDLKMSWNVLVELPAAARGSALQLNTFSTDMPVFEHRVGDLGKTVLFRALSLNTANKPITVQSLSAVTAEVTNANAAITGSFKASSALKLTSANAKITAAVDLVYGGGAATELIVNNAHALIDTSVSLYSSLRGHTGGQFKVSATTSAAPVTIAFPTAPVNSALSLNATTALAPATVTLHKTYEGLFALGTSLSQVTLNVDKNVTDPAGKGRSRKVDIKSQTKVKLDGSVAWVPSKADTLAAGSVKVTTSLGPATLNL